MIRLRIVATALGVIGAISPAGSHHRVTPIKVGEGQQEGIITYNIAGVTPGMRTPGVSPPAGAVVPNAGGVRPVATRVSTPSTVGCVTIIGVSLSPTAKPVAMTQGLPCSGPAPKAAPPKPKVVSPGTVAATYWAQDGANQLPSPHPYIAPGYALAGLPGYLEVRAPLSTTLTDSTRLGTLAIHATASVFVNWGDGGSNDGPYHSAGAPYPNGTITHYWDYDGTYDIVVYEDWTATWYLAGASGHLGGLQTLGSIPTFAVSQLESVRGY